MLAQCEVCVLVCQQNVWDRKVGQVGMGWAKLGRRGGGDYDRVENGQVGMAWLAGWGLEDGVQGPVKGTRMLWGSAWLRDSHTSHSLM